MIQTQVSTKYQVVIPKKIRKEAGIKPGQKMDVSIEGKRIVLTPGEDFKNWKWPDDYIKNLPNPWEGEDSVEWLKKERDSWGD